MKMATICFPFTGNLIGGSHVSSAGLLQRIDLAHFQPLVLLQHETGAIATLFQEAAIPFEAAPPSPALEHGQRIAPATALRLLAAAPRLATFLRQRQVDIVHCNDGRTLATWALAARMAGAKLLWHHRGAPDALGLRLLAPAIASRVVSVSHFSAPQPGLYSAASRTEVIHSPFDTDLHHDRNTARATLLAELPQATTRTAVIGFSGALIDRKRPLLFVEAIAALRHLSPDHDVHGVIFGEALGDMAQRIHGRAMELGVGHNIHLMGYRAPGPYWLASCDLLMVPAINEPFGRTLIEAMLVGTPVVATASGGNMEAVRDGQTGRLVQPENARALALACLGLLNDTALAQAIATTAKADAKSRFGKARHAEAIMALYTDMLASKRGIAGQQADRERVPPVVGQELRG